MTREGVVTFVSKLPVCIVAMEACCGAHFLGRAFQAQGHTVRLMSPEYVQPYPRKLGVCGPVKDLGSSRRSSAYREGGL